MRRRQFLFVEKEFLKIGALIFIILNVKNPDNLFQKKELLRS